MRLSFSLTVCRSLGLSLEKQLSFSLCHPYSFECGVIRPLSLHYDEAEGHTIVWGQLWWQVATKTDGLLKTCWDLWRAEPAGAAGP
jgi:hypothetical protein